MRTAALCAVALVLGAATGVASVLLHQRLGWLLLAAAVGLLAVALLPTRPPRVFWALASGAVVMRAAVARPEGDFLVPGNGLGWGLIGTAALVLLVALILPDRRADPADQGPPT